MPAAEPIARPARTVGAAEGGIAAGFPPRLFEGADPIARTVIVRIAPRINAVTGDQAIARIHHAAFLIEAVWAAAALFGLARLALRKR